MKFEFPLTCIVFEGREERREVRVVVREAEQVAVLEARASLANCAYYF